MDLDEPSKLVQDLKLRTATIEGSRLDLIVVGKIVGARVVNMERLLTQIPRIVQMRNVLDIEIVGDNQFVYLSRRLRERPF